MSSRFYLPIIILVVIGAVLVFVPRLAEANADARAKSPLPVLADGDTYLPLIMRRVLPKESDPTNASMVPSGDRAS